MLKKIAVLAVLAVAGGYLAWTLSPWPSALLYRALMDRDGAAVHAALSRHVPAGIREERNVSYADGALGAGLDVFRPPGSEARALPVVVWVHGGGFLAGSKDLVANYLRVIAGRGYAVVGVDYALAPGQQYPGPVRQVSAALRFLQDNAARFRLDMSRVVLAGDSAGAQIAGQMTAVIVAPAQAAAPLGLTPPLAREQLRGAVLFCGIHDTSDLVPSGPFAGFVRTAAWSYLGVKDIAGDPRIHELSTVKRITPAFPPLFISAGNGDPLGPHSKTLAKAAEAQGIAVDSLFFPDGYQPSLPHEYQFNLDTEAGKQALARMLAFLAHVTG